jgi:transcription elongation factor Elf1
MEWDVDENTALTPDDIIYTNQRKKILWKCPEAFDHVWEKSVYERTVDGTDCPFCNHRRPSSTNNLLDKYPEVARLLHPTLNKEVDLSTIAPNSHVKLWWKCPNGDDHVWQSTPNSMKGQPQCGFCNGKRVSVTNSLATRFPEIAQEFDL